MFWQNVARRNGLDATSVDSAQSREGAQGRKEEKALQCSSATLPRTCDLATGKTVGKDH